VYDSLVQELIDRVSSWLLT